MRPGPVSVLVGRSTSWKQKWATLAEAPRAVLNKSVQALSRLCAGKQAYELVCRCHLVRCKSVLMQRRQTSCTTCRPAKGARQEACGFGCKVHPWQSPRLEATGDLQLPLGDGSWVLALGLHG